jgi:hypothetical protein
VALLQQEARIVRVFRTAATGARAGDGDPTRMTHVSARMSDCSVAPVARFRPGTNTVTDDELIGRTAAAARRLAASHGETL